MADCVDCVVLVCASQPFVSLPDFGSLSLSPALLLFAASLAMASSSALVSSSFLARRAVCLEHIASVGLAPPMVSMLYSIEAVIIDQFLDEILVELEGTAAGVDTGSAAVVVDPFLLSPPPLSPASDSEGGDVVPALDDGVPGLVLARALVPFSAVPVTPPVALPPAGAVSPRLRPSRRWASGVLPELMEFPYEDAVAAVRAVQREDVVWYNGDVRLLPLPAPPSPPPRRSLRLLRRRLQ